VPWQNTHGESQRQFATTNGLTWKYLQLVEAEIVVEYGGGATTGATARSLGYQTPVEFAVTCNWSVKRTSIGNYMPGYADAGTRRTALHGSSCSTVPGCEANRCFDLLVHTDEPCRLGTLTVGHAARALELICSGRRARARLPLLGRVRARRVRRALLLVPRVTRPANTPTYHVPSLPRNRRVVIVIKHARARPTAVDGLARLKAERREIPRIDVAGLWAWCRYR